MVKTLLKKIHWLGHDGFRIDAEKVICIDPFQLQSAVAADILLVTHDHFDHCSPDDIQKIQKPGTVTITDKAAAEKLTGDLRIMKPGDRLTVEGMEIEAVPAYNTNKEFHPKADGKLGFILTIDGMRIYHAGDTDRIPEMKTVRADIALLPVSGTYVMTADEAAGAALDISPTIAIPMHYGAIVGSADDAQAFADRLRGKIEVRILPKE